MLSCLAGELGLPKLLVGLANGLAGRSPVWLIWDGRLTNGLVFSGDSEAAFVGEKALFGLAGDCVGVVARTVAGDWLFWRLKGDCRPAESKDRGDGRIGVDCDN